MTIHSHQLGKVFYLISFLLAIWAYFPGLSGGFIFDDVNNVSQNEYLKIDKFTFENVWQASFSSNSGPLKRPVAMFSFALNHLYTGMDAWSMKVTNLGIHLFNSLLLLFVLRQLFFRIQQLSSFSTQLAPYIISGIWLIHPINITSVSYIVQRMTSLSASFVLIALYIYLKIRNEKLESKRFYISSLLLFISWSLGILTKENALLLSMYVFSIEWVLYGFQGSSRTQQKQLRLLWLLLATPWILGLLYVSYKPIFLLGAYDYRDFTLVERVLTELRVMVDYLRLILVPDIRDIGLYHDNIVLSKSLISPPTTLLSLFFIIGLLFAAIKFRKKYILFSLGILFFFAGHILESTVHPLELVFLHRNYLPGVGILLALTQPACALSSNYHNYVVASIVFVVMAHTYSTRSISHQWSGDFRMLIIEALNNKDSIRANFRAGQVFKVYAMNEENEELREEYKQGAIEYFTNILEIDDRNLGGQMGILETYLQLNEQPPESFIDELVEGLRSTKIDIGLVNLLNSVKACVIAETCSLNEEDYYRILESLLNNPELNGDYRRKALVMHAEFLVRAKNDYDEGIRTLLEAIVTHPTHDDLVLLIDYYELGGYPEEMENTINYLETQDKVGRFSKVIREARERLR